MGSSQRQKAASESIYRMETVLSKDSGQTIAFGSLTSSPWFSTKQLQLSLSKCGAPPELENTSEQCYDHAKESESLYQEQDSSSTLSSGLVHHEGPTMTRSNSNMQNISFQPGLFETQTKKGEACTKPYLSWGNEDYVNSQLQGQHMSSLACNSSPFAEPYFGGVITAYGPNAVVYPKLMGITPARVVLPLDYTEGIPVYVNAKQYHAILRRRQIRAKLEVHTKAAKARKPYLHESRHRHALKRARGIGGRFLNTKTTQQAKSSTQMYAKDLSLKHMGGEKSEPEIQLSGSNSWGTSTQSSSEVSCIFNNEDVYQQQDFRASFGTVHNGTRSRVLAPDESVLLSVDRYTRISTAM